MSRLTTDDMARSFGLLRTDPQRYLALAEQYVRENPEDSDACCGRHNARVRLGRCDLALADLDRAIALMPDRPGLEARGDRLREMGQYAAALQDCARAEDPDPAGWRDGFGPLFRADCHARLGHEAVALADCEQLPDDHWTPGLSGAPAGSKAEVIEAVRRIAAAARQQQQK